MTDEPAAPATPWDVFWRVATRAHRGRCRLCATGSRLAAPECVDAIHDDAEALHHRYDLQVRRGPIRSLPAWATSALGPASVDAHRRARGARGALQRPRVPGWLDAALDGDRRYVLLAKKIIEWVGVPASAGTDEWPYRAWCALLAPLAPDPARYSEGHVTADVKHVLQVMRTTKPAWFAAYIDEPLGRKPLPVVAESEQPDRPDEARSAAALAHERADRQLLEAAARVVEAIELTLARGDRPPVDAVRHILVQVLGPSLTSPLHADHVPGTGPADHTEVLSAALADDRIDALVADLLEIVRDGGETPSPRPARSPSTDRGPQVGQPASG